MRKRWILNDFETCGIDLIRLSLIILITVTYFQHLLQLQYIDVYSIYCLYVYILYKSVLYLSSCLRITSQFWIVTIDPIDAELLFAGTSAVHGSSHMVSWTQCSAVVSEGSLCYDHLNILRM